jgi:hypothetical protein
MSIMADLQVYRAVSRRGHKINLIFMAIPYGGAPPKVLATSAPPAAPAAQRAVHVDRFRTSTDDGGRAGARVWSCPYPQGVRIASPGSNGVMSFLFSCGSD